MGVFIFFNYNLIAQNCLVTNNLQHEVKNECNGQGNGQIIFTFEQRVEGIIENRVGLYLKDQKVFFRNQLNTAGLKIKGKEITYDNLPSGSYQLVVYIKDCPEFPKPKMYPSGGIIVTNEENCRQ